MPYASVLRDKVKYNIPKSRLNIVKRIIKIFLKAAVCTLREQSCCFQCRRTNALFSLRPVFYFVNEVILGQFVRVAFMYIESMQTFASVLFGLENSAPAELRHIINSGLALGPLSRVSADKAAR